MLGLICSFKMFCTVFLLVGNPEEPQTGLLSNQGEKV